MAKSSSLNNSNEKSSGANEEETTCSKENDEKTLLKSEAKVQVQENPYYCCERKELAEG